MKLRALSILVLAFVLPLLAVSAHADTLGAADSFAVLAGSTVTNDSGTGAPTIVNGNLGVSPGSAVTGFGPGIVIGGTIHAGDSLAAGAQGDVFTNTPNAFTILAGEGATGTTVTGGVLNTFNGGCGLGCFSPGNYLVPNAISNLMGTIFLNDGGVAGSQFIFYTGAANTLITSSNSVVDVSGLSPTDSVFWVVGSSATLGDSSVLEGNILAYASITFNPGAQDPCGRALAQTGGVGFDGANPATTTGVPNEISIGCGGNLAGSNGLGGGLNSVPPISTPGPGPATVPEPGTFALLLCGLLPIGLVTLRKLRPSPLTNCAEVL
jgi:type VI secretion system secreted protein VgrG